MEMECCWQRKWVGDVVCDENGLEFQTGFPEQISINCNNPCIWRQNTSIIQWKSGITPANIIKSDCFKAAVLPCLIYKS